METQTSVQTKPTAKITIPPNGNVIVDEDQDEFDLDDFELNIFTPQTNMAKRPSDVDEILEQVDKVLAKGKTLGALNDKFVDTYVIKGNKELYELLAAIYGFMLQVNESAYKDHILKRMREQLKDSFDIALQESSTVESIVVRYVVPKDRQTAFNYARVLKVAFIENIAAKDLSGYISGRGGISKIQDTLENVQNAVEEKKSIKRKLSLYKKIILARTKVASKPIKINKGKKLSLVPYGTKPAMFDFAVLSNIGGEDYRIHQVVQLPLAVGDQWLNYISQNVIVDDLELVQDKLDELRARLGIAEGYGMQPGDKGYKPLVMNPQADASAEEVDVDDSNDLETPEEAVERVALEHP